MKPSRQLLFVISALLCGTLAAGQTDAAKRTGASARPATPQPIPTASAADVEPGARVVQYGERDVLKLKAKLGYTTLIVLPKDEQILDFVCGDKEFWVVNGVQNLAYIKPAKPSAQANLNLITASGNIYSFVLTEVSALPQSAPDLKVFVEPKEESMVSAAKGTPRFVSAQVVEDYRQQVVLAKQETQALKQAAQAEIDTGVSKFVSNVQFRYRFEAGKKPFFVRAMYNDDKFTYIQARPEETPTLYEIQDGKPNLVNFEYKNGVYVIGKILDRGYLVIGKRKLNFVREQ